MHTIRRTELYEFSLCSASAALEAHHATADDRLGCAMGVTLKYIRLHILHRHLSLRTSQPPQQEHRCQTIVLGQGAFLRRALCYDTTVPPWPRLPVSILTVRYCAIQRRRAVAMSNWASGYRHACGVQLVRPLFRVEIGNARTGVAHAQVKACVSERLKTLAGNDDGNIAIAVGVPPHPHLTTNPRC